MYGLTDNIVAGPAGQTFAAAAGSFVVGPPGSFTPAPAGHTPVTPATEPVPPTGAGYVPIDTTPARIPYAAAAGGGMHYTSGSTLSPIPGPSAHVPVTPNTSGGVSGGGGGIVTGGGGISSGGGGGGYVSGGGGVSSASGNAGASSVSGAGSSGAGIGGGGVQAASGHPPVSGNSGGSVAQSTNTGGAPSQASSTGGGTGTGGGMSTVAYAGVGFPPLEMRVGQAATQATGNAPTTPGTEGFTVTPGGRTVPTPVGYVHPPPASRFHAPQKTHVAHHPMSVKTQVTTAEAYEPYKAPYVWPGKPEATPPPAFLSTDYLKPSPYDPPHVIFGDERPSATVTVDASIGANGGMQTNETVIRNLTQDFSQTRNVEFTTNALNERNLVLDNSISRNVDQSFPEYREVTVNLVFAQSPPMPEPLRVDPSQLLGGPIMARVA